MIFLYAFGPVRCFGFTPEDYVREIYRMPDWNGDDSDNDEDAPGARFNEGTETIHDDGEEDDDGED